MEKIVTLVLVERLETPTSFYKKKQKKEKIKKNKDPKH